MILHPKTDSSDESRVGVRSAGNVGSNRLIVCVCVFFNFSSSPHYATLPVIVPPPLSVLLRMAPSTLGPAFHASLESPRFVVAPMVDQSELVSRALMLVCLLLT